MLLQDQIDQQNRLDSIVVEQRLKQIREQLHDFPDLQQHYSQLLLRDRLRREQEVESDFLARAQLQQQEEFQRRALAQTQAQTQQTGSAARPQTPPTPQTLAQNPGAKGANAQAAAHSLLRDIAADSLAGNAIKRSDLERRVFAKPDENVVLGKKKQPNGLDDSGEGERKRKKKKEKTAKKSDDSTLMIAELSKVATELSGESTLKPSAQALLDFASSGVSPAVVSVDQQEVPGQAFGTLSDILEAAESEKRADEAVSVLTTIKRNAEWSDSEGEEDAEAERQIAIKKGDAIVLPNFTSVLPQLPEEPELIPPSPGKKKKKKHKGLMDDDSVGTRSDGKPKAEKREVKESSVQASSLEVPIVEYPYPIDPWWPSVSSIRKERKANGQTLDESENDEKSEILDESPFRANLTRIKEQLATDVAPGVLEKIPHCQIHRLLTRKRKNPSAPENVFCFQVTELYPNDLMVCCSHCGTWRHAACGGHYKPYSVRECIDTPFNAVCDRCHYEEKILRDHPIARRRIDRQRSEQIRRGLATSAAMRQASFSKHGGTYKWPLGSVSATHIGGHTRSVHHRHDKAEKQWMEMAQRLGRNNDKRPKERVKIRTKELERLLVAVEDAGMCKLRNGRVPCWWNIANYSVNFLRGTHGSTQHDAIFVARYPKRAASWI